MIMYIHTYSYAVLYTVDTNTIKYIITTVQLNLKFTEHACGMVST